MKAPKSGEKFPESKQKFRYWVEVREVASGTVSSLPLSAVAKIHIPRKSEFQRPTEEIVQLTDGADILRATNLDGLAAQIRERYPDGKYERTLHTERDRKAEERHADAMNRLVQLIVAGFVASLSQDDAAALGRWSKTGEGKRAFRESWPKIVDGYFHALCNPKR
jgi:hypothetical protein